MPNINARDIKANDTMMGETASKALIKITSNTYEDAFTKESATFCSCTNFRVFA